MLRARSEVDLDAPRHHRVLLPVGKHAYQHLQTRGIPLRRIRIGGVAMEVVHERCCGLDVHKQTVVACVIVPGKASQPNKQIRTFGTMTPGPARVGRLAGRVQRDPRGDGIDRRLLEADLEPARGAVRVAAGQCPAHQAGAWPQDRRQGLRVVGRPAAARLAARQLRARPATARVARVDTLSHHPGPRARLRDQSPAEDARGRQHQAQQCGHRHYGRLRSPHHAGAGGWPN